MRETVTLDIVISPADLDAGPSGARFGAATRFAAGRERVSRRRHPETLHVGAFLAGKLVAVASVCHEPPPGERDAAAWRVRGMATLPEQRGRGLGGKLLEHCLQHARALGGRRLWCSARVAVAAFYHAWGFVSVGEPFVLPQYSEEPYIRMEHHLAG